jgi:hypothetical protein
MGTTGDIFKGILHVLKKQIEHIFYTILVFFFDFIFVPLDQIPLGEFVTHDGMVQRQLVLNYYKKKLFYTPYPHLNNVSIQEENDENNNQIGSNKSHSFNYSPYITAATGQTKDTVTVESANNKTKSRQANVGVLKKRVMKKMKKKTQI